MHKTITDPGELRRQLAKLKTAAEVLRSTQVSGAFHLLEQTLQDLQPLLEEVHLSPDTFDVVDNARREVVHARSDCLQLSGRLLELWEMLEHGVIPALKRQAEKLQPPLPQI